MTLDAEAAVTVLVTHASQRGASVGRGIRRGGAACVLRTDESLIAAGELASVRVGARRGRAAAAPVGAGVALGARNWLAGAAGLAPRSRAAGVRGDGAGRGKRRRVSALSHFALGAARHVADTCTAGALEAIDVCGADERFVAIEGWKRAEGGRPVFPGQKAGDGCGGPTLVRRATTAVPGRMHAASALAHDIPDGVDSAV